MRMAENDVRWLWQHQPLLATGLKTTKIAGTLALSAYYDGRSRRVVSNRYHSPQSHETYIADQFAIKIRLDSLDSNGWPKVNEIGMRHKSIARRCGIPIEDLHFYRNGDACLGFSIRGIHLSRWRPLCQNLSSLSSIAGIRRLLWIDGDANRSVARVFTRWGRASRAPRRYTSTLSGSPDYLTGALDTSRLAVLGRRKSVSTAASRR